MESIRSGALPAAPVPIEGVTAITFAHPGWRVERTRIPNLRRLGAHARNAYHIGFHELLRRGDYAMSYPMPVERFTPEWLEAWSVK